MDAGKIMDCIKAASSSLFKRYGYNKTSVNEIAKKANIAKATIYKYFESKEHILYAIIMDYLRVSINKLADKNTDGIHDKERMSQLIMRTSRLSYVACNEFIGWGFIRESTNAQQFLQNLSNDLEEIILNAFNKMSHAQAFDMESQRRIRFVVNSAKSIVFSFAFVSVSDSDVKKNFVQFQNDILPYLLEVTFPKK
jgi:AcrR family transcriptional regulator